MRAAVAVPAALALALPVAAATNLLAGQRAFASVTAPAPSCTSAGLDTASGGAASGGSREAVAKKAAAQWFPADQVAIATAIAGAESSWNPTAVNKAAGGNYGLWQINSVHKDLLKGRNWRDPKTNAWMAFQVWDAADGHKGDRSGRWTPWSVYNSGSYRSYLRAGDAPSTPGDCAAPGQPQVRVATWNVRRSNSKTKIVTGARELAVRADVFGLQEMGSPAHRSVVAGSAAASGFTMSTDRTAVPILYRTAAYTLLSQGRQLAIRSGSKVEPTGSDPSKVTANKYVTWVHLMDNATLQDFYVLNTHMLVGAYGSEKQRKNNKRRVALYKQQLGTLTKLSDGFSSLGAAVYAVCDCNVDYTRKAAPVVTMQLHGLSASFEMLDDRATHGKRTIDYVWSNATPASHRTGAKNGSDHKPLAVTYLSSSVNVIAPNPTQTLLRTRTVTDPQSGRTFQVPIPTGRAGKAMSFALDQVGDQWKWGKHGPAAWDCSGLTAAAFKAAGIKITAQSDAQRKSLKRVPLAEARPGDIFWRKGYVSIFLGSVGSDRIVVGSLRSKGAVVLHTADESDIKAVLRPGA